MRHTEQDLWHSFAHVLDWTHFRVGARALHFLSSKMKGLAAPEQNATKLFLNPLSPVMHCRKSSCGWL
jgi:hypothetical protein